MARPRVRVALLLGACLLSAGCGGGGNGSGSGGGAHSARVAATSRRGKTVPQGPSSSSAAASASSSSGSSTTPALAGSGRPTVTIGDKNYDEQFVLGQLYQQALEAQGFTVDLTQNIGPPAVFTRALADGSLAMYPEYLTTFDQTVAGLRGHPHTRARTLRAGRRWASAHGLRLLPPTPFSDTQAIAVTVGYAAAHRLRSLTDLRRVGASLVIGGAAQLKSENPGLPALSDVYGVLPSQFHSIGVGDQYDKLDDGTIQAAYVNSTDGQLATDDYRLLADPRHVFGFGNVVPVVSRAALAKEGPAFAATIRRVDRTLTTTAMRALNGAVGVAGASPTAVAKQYLETHGLLAPLPAASSLAARG